MGCLALELSESTPEWESAHPILLVENQCLFDDLSWLPQGWQGILLYYAGMLSHWLIDWLSRSIFTSIELFPDYDGVGLKNFARLRTSVLTAGWHWRADWEQALERFGNPSLWQKEEQRKSIDDLWQEWEALGWPDARLRPLVTAMRTQGKMLEQEWVLMPSSLKQNSIALPCTLKGGGSQIP